MDRGKWKRGQKDHWIGEKIIKHEIYFISQDREKKREEIGGHTF